jgi:hypothetical protein
MLLKSYSSKSSRLDAVAKVDIPDSASLALFTQNKVFIAHYSILLTSL